MLAYDTRGTGPEPVLMLHGFLGSGRNLASLARRLVEVRPALTAILPDLTGHGVSPPLPVGADLGTLADDVLALADHLGLARPLRVIGHSLGGRVGMALRLRAPAAVAELTFLDIPPGPLGTLAGGQQQVLERLLQAPDSAPTRDAMRAFFLAGGVPPALTDWVLMNLVMQDGAMRWRIDRNALQAFHTHVTRPDLWPAIEQPGARLRCVRGGASGYVTDADVQRLARAGVPTVTLAGAGHFVHVDAQAALVAALTDPVSS